MDDNPVGQLQHREITKEMEESYLDYAMSVIVARALPDVRDGLKPVHRRILYTMHEMGLTAGAHYRKSAAIVGDALGKYHPHGDAALYDSMARLAQDFSMRYPLVDGQGNFGCFTKDTEVKLTDGRSVNFDQLIREDAEGKKNFTYTVNKPGLISIAAIKYPRKTRSMAELVQVVLDNGRKIRCTPNHRFMMRDGSYRTAETLVAGDSLMPLYERLSEKKDRLNREGYLLVYQPKKDEWVPAHHLADNYNLSIRAYQKSAGRVRHHKDFNKLNNNPTNIARISWGEHWKIHYQHAVAQHADPIYRQKIAEGRTKFWSQSSVREAYAERISQRNKANWQDLAYRENMRKFLSKSTKAYIEKHPEKRKEFSARATATLKRLWEKPSYRSFMHEKILKGNRNHLTNNTGKKKFLTICKEALRLNPLLDERMYEQAWKSLYPYGAATKWETGLEKYFQNDPSLILQEINRNHKVVKVERLKGKEDVYDLTIDGTHNFALADGIFVHNSIDGDSPAAMRYCVTGDTLVATSNGLMPIKDISSGGKEAIKISILSKDRQVHSASKWFDSGRHPTFAITTHRGFSLRGSFNHPVLIWTKNFLTGLPELRWKLLQDIRVGDVAVIDRTPDLLWPAKNVSLAKYRPKNLGARIQKKKLPKKLDEDLAFILGSFLAEGTLKEKELEFCNTDAEWMNEFSRRWAKVFPDCRLHAFDRRPNSYGKKPYKTFEVHSRYVIEFLHNLGMASVKSGQRTIPHSILRSPKAVVASFVRAYFEGDGTITFSSKMTELSAISKSEELMKQLQILLLRFGISSTKRFDKYRSIHKLYLRGLNNYSLFTREIGFVSERKKTKLVSAVARLHKEQTQSDCVPFLADFLRGHADASLLYNRRKFLWKHNFDRYAEMKENHQRIIALLEPRMETQASHLFTELLDNHYLFDPIVKVERGAIENVYSLKVESDCHSFVANGFINHNTEARMTKIAGEMLRDIDKETVPWVDNYDGTRKEPQVLPAALPQLLLNGTMGIAVGMATNIPPHNLGEVVDALIHLIDRPKATTEDLFQFVQGPDFPTGGTLYGKKSILEAYGQGKGPMLVRGEAEVHEEGEKRGVKGTYIEITEIPYQVNKAALIEKIAELVQDGRLEGIRDVRDESDKDGMSVIIELKKDAHPQKVLNNLYKFTELQKTFHLNMLALVDGIQPQVLSLKGVLEHYLAHKFDVVRKRTEFDLARARERAHILEGLKKALDHIDAVIKTIRGSNDREDAHKNLKKKFAFSDAQANAILDMRLQNLANLERRKVEDELKEKQRIIKELTLLLKDEKRMREKVKEEFKELKERYGDERKTKVRVQSLGEFREEDLIPNEETIVLITRDGYIKRVAPNLYQPQHRGGKGIMGIANKGEDLVEHFFAASTHDRLLFFTSKGRVFQTIAYEIPRSTRIGKGKALVNFLDLEKEEAVTAVIPLEPASRQAGLPAGQAGAEKGQGKFLVMATKNGIIKKTEFEQFEAVRRNGLIALHLRGDDALRWVSISSGKDEIMLATREGQSVRFAEHDVRSMGRTAAGVTAIRLHKGDEVVGMDIVNEKNRKNDFLVVMENGYGKRTSLTQFKTQHRGGSGIKAAQITQKTGRMASAHVLADQEELIVVSQGGNVIRTKISGVPRLGRATQGVRIMKLNAGDKIASAIIV